MNGPISQQTCNRGDSSPICFIVGPGRSGSTLLYKVLSLHPDIGFISNYDARFPHLPIVSRLAELALGRAATKLFAWFEKGGGAYYLRRPILKKLVPTPVEGETLFAASGIKKGGQVATDEAVCENLRTSLGRLRARKGKPVLLIKRTALNKSIPLLIKAFPQARFIYLVRDGRSVASSLLKVEWWSETPLPWADDRTPVDLQAEGMDMTWIAARNWMAGVEYAEEGLKDIPEEQVYSLRYEDFLNEPANKLKQIQAFLNLPVSDEFNSAVAELSLANRPDSWPRQLTQQQQETVLQAQSEHLSRYGYL